MTESDIIEEIKKQEDVVSFRIQTEQELEKCTPFYYCSNKFLDKVCKPDTSLPGTCGVKIEASGGERDSLGPGKVLGTCTIKYFGCDPSTIASSKTEEPVVDKVDKDKTSKLTEKKEDDNDSDEYEDYD